MSASNNISLKVQTLDFVTSAYNEQDNIYDLYEEIEMVMQKFDHIEWNFIISDNSSSDNTWPEIVKLKNKKNNVQGIRLSRNFGFENSILAALNQSNSAFVVILMSDLQDDVSYIPKFIELAEEGYDHVYQIVTNRPDVSKIRRFNSVLFYRIAKYLSKGQILENVAEYRLITGKVRDSLLKLQEQNRFTRGLISWLGFESIGVPFPRRSRKKGISKASSFEVIALAVRGILSHSYMLLDLISILGLIASFLSLVLFSVFIVIWILNGGVLYSLGFFSTLALFGFGIILTALGLISKYISLIYEEVKARPHYIIKDRI